MLEQYSGNVLLNSKSKKFQLHQLGIQVLNEIDNDKYQDTLHIFYK